MDLLDTQLHDLIGSAGFARLTAAFYRRVPADDLLGSLYDPSDLAAAEQRLRSFLVMRFGGPDDYLRLRGHPRLRMRHAPFPVDRAARDRWVNLMEQAIGDADLPPPASAMLRAFFQDAATFLINRGP